MRQKPRYLFPALAQNAQVEAEIETTVSLRLIDSADCVANEPSRLRTRGPFANKNLATQGLRKGSVL